MAMACHGHGEMRMALTAWRSPARPLMPALALGDSSHATPMPDLAELHWYVWCPWNVYQYVYKYDYYQCIYICILSMYIIYIYQIIYYIFTWKSYLTKTCGRMWASHSDILQHTSHLKPIKPKQIRKICLDVYPKWNHDHITIIQYITIIIHNNL